MKRNHFLFITILFNSINCFLFGQSPSIQWQKCLGGSNDEYVTDIKLTSDGGYIITGTSNSNDGDVSGSHWFSDIWIVKLSDNANIQWQKCIGGSSSDYVFDIKQTSDGGYIITGKSNSNDGDVSGNHGYDDLWIVKISNNGNIVWQKCYGGSSSESGNSIQQTSDGGFIVAGSSNSNDEDVSGNHGSDDVWIVKLTTNGNIQWQKCLGGSSIDLAYDIKQTSDGGYIITGNSESDDGDVSGNHGSYDVWIVKLSDNGNIQWQKCLGGSCSDYIYDIKQTSDDGYIITGCSNSNDGDVSGNHGDFDVWIVKLSDIGNIQWQKCLGGSDAEAGFSILQTNDSGYIIAGFSSSNDGDVSENHGIEDLWIVKISNNGNIVWQKCFGGSSLENGNSIQQTSDGGYIVAGDSRSNDGDVIGNHGSRDVWIVKLSHDNTNIIENNKKEQTQIFPNPAKSVIDINFDIELIGEKYQICNSIGQVILTGIIFSESEKIDLSKFSRGLYLIKIGKKNNQTIKLIIE